MRLLPGLCPGPAGGAYSAPPNPLADFKRAASQYARNGHKFITIRCNIQLQRNKRGKGNNKRGKGGGLRMKGGGRGKGGIAAVEIVRGRGELGTGPPIG